MHPVTANSFLSIPRHSRHGKSTQFAGVCANIRHRENNARLGGACAVPEAAGGDPRAEGEVFPPLGSSGVATPRMIRMGAALALGAARRRISLGADGLSKCKQILNTPINWGTGGFFDKNKKKKRASSHEVPASSLVELEMLGGNHYNFEDCERMRIPTISLKKKNLKKREEKSYSFQQKDSKKLFSSQLAQQISSPTFEVCQNSRQIPAGS